MGMSAEVQLCSSEIWYNLLGNRMRSFLSVDLSQIPGYLGVRVQWGRARWISRYTPNNPLVTQEQESYESLHPARSPGNNALLSPPSWLSAGRNWVQRKEWGPSPSPLQRVWRCGSTRHPRGYKGYSSMPCTQEQHCRITGKDSGRGSQCGEEGDRSKSLWQINYIMLWELLQLKANIFSSGPVKDKWSIILS